MTDKYIQATAEFLKTIDIKTTFKDVKESDYGDVGEALFKNFAAKNVKGITVQEQKLNSGLGDGSDSIFIKCESGAMYVAKETC